MKSVVFLLLILQLSLLCLYADQLFSINQQLDRSTYYSGQSGYVTVSASNGLSWDVYVKRVVVSFSWNQNFSLTFSTPKVLKSHQTASLGDVKFSIPLDDPQGNRFSGDYSYMIYVETSDNVYGTRIWSFGPYPIRILKAMPSLSLTLISYTKVAEQDSYFWINITLENSGMGPSTNTELRVYVDGNPMFYKRLDVVEPGIHGYSLSWIVPVPDIVAGDHNFVVKISCRELSEPVVSDTLKIRVEPPYKDYFMSHLGNLANKVVNYQRVIGGKEVTVSVDYRVIMGAKKTKYCGLNNIPPPFDTDNQISQWRAGFSANRMYNSINDCWYLVYFPVSYKG